jgi:hypothetical protein
MNSGPDVFEAVRRANPVPQGSIDESVYASASELFALLNAAGPRGEVLVDTAPSPKQHVRRHRSLLVTAAAGAVMAIFVCAVVLAVRDDPILRVPAAAPTTPPAEELARGFVEAWGAFDADRAIGLLAADADITGVIDWFTTEDVQGTRDELRLLLSLLEAQSYEQMLDSCDELSRTATETTVHCTFDFHSLRSDELGLGPFSGSYFDLTVRDGAIVRASTNLNSDEFSSQVWSPFADWMEANHPDDAAAIYTPGANGARLTAEAIPLWGPLTQEYVFATATTPPLLSLRIFPEAGPLATGDHEWPVRQTMPTPLFWFTVSREGWRSGGYLDVPRGGGWIETGTPGTPDGAIIRFWRPDILFADPCRHTRLNPQPSSSDLPAAVAAIPGTELVSGPTTRFSGQQVVLRIPEEIECDPQQFYLWAAFGHPRAATERGSTITVSIIDPESVAGPPIFVEAETYEGASPELQREVQQIVDSVRQGGGIG